MSRAITIKQPWAYAILHQGKNVENRTTNLGRHRGPLLIHAGQTWDTAATVTNPADGLLYYRGTTVRMPDGFGALPAHAASRPYLYGGILGIVDLVGIHGALECLTEDGHCSPWAEPTGWHMVLANPRPLPKPITHLPDGEPIRGRLGLWRVPAGVWLT